MPDRRPHAAGQIAPAAHRPIGEGRYLAIDAFDEWGIRALVTTRAAGSFSTASDEPVAAVMQRWAELQRELYGVADGRFATARQVHGAVILEHVPGWTGWLRGGAADGHLAAAGGTATAVTVADCVPVFVAHPSGATALLHSGWRGTVAGIVPAAVARMATLGFAARELRVLLGPAICGDCYEVSPDVYAALTGREVERPTPVDLHGVIADQAHRCGVADVRRTALCTRCDNATLFSHRAGDAGRQLGVLFAG